MTRVPLPKVAFVPGLTPRPPESWLDSRLAEIVPANPAETLGCPAFRFGFDLYHAGFFWEAHEVWERLWQVARRDPARKIEATALQTLILITACELHLRMGNPPGADRLAKKAWARANPAPESPRDEK